MPRMKAAATILLTALLLVPLLEACGGQAQNIQIIAAVKKEEGCVLPPGAKTDLSLTGSLPSDAVVTWESGNVGIFKSTGQFTASYTPPDNPGPNSIPVSIQAVVKSGGRAYPVTLLCEVKPAAITPTNTLTATSTPPATATPTLPPPPTATDTAAPTPTFTPTPPPLADTCEINKWGLDNKGAKGDLKQNIVSQAPGKEDGCAMQVSYDIKANGYTILTRNLDYKLFLGIPGIRFDYKGSDVNSSNANDTIEVKLMFRFPNATQDTTYGFNMYRSTDTDDTWKSQEIRFEQFECWWFTPECTKYGKTLNAENVKYLLRMDFAIKDNPDRGDSPGSGYVIFEDVMPILPQSQ